MARGWARWTLRKKAGILHWEDTLSWAGPCRLSRATDQVESWNLFIDSYSPLRGEAGPAREQTAIATFANYAAKLFSYMVRNENDLVTAIKYWVTAEACSQLVRWQEQDCRIVGR